MEKILKITALNRAGNLYKSQYGRDADIIYQKVSKENIEYGKDWYLHGKLERRIGFDKGFITNLTSFGHYEKYLDKFHLLCNLQQGVAIKEEDFCYNKLKMNGIVPVDVEGIKERCLGFFWVSEEEPFQYYYNGIWHWTLWCQKGLIILESDQEAFDDCYSLYFTKSYFV